VTQKFLVQPRNQQGVALIILLALLGIVAIAVLLTIVRGSAEAVEREKRTTEALAKAREALIAYAVSVQPDTSAKRPGDLPCPDLDNDGDTTLPEATCNTPTQRIGRLPWKKLGIGDLRDGNGERLWYALSTKFQRTTVNQCPAVGGAGCLNSEAPGTITVRDSRGNILHDGTTAANSPSVVPTGAIAVVFSPGPVLTRLGAGAPQDRSCAGDANVPACELSGICSGPAYTATARCNPVNFLDVADPTVAPALSGVEDNQDFADSTTTNGFISGPIVDASNNLVVNDTLMVVRYSDLIPRLEQRVAGEALKCLEDYFSGLGHYPWAAPVASDYTTPMPVGLTGVVDTYFGRLPQTLSDATSWAAPCPAAMDTAAKKWWGNWSNLVFFAIASNYAPVGGSMFLTVNPPSAAANKKVVVLVAGRPLNVLVPSPHLQSRGVGATELNYLEDANADAIANGADIGTGILKQAHRSITFDDSVVFR
jgi:type II secretory pathway pseudopilin PulG